MKYNLLLVILFIFYGCSQKEPMDLTVHLKNPVRPVLEVALSDAVLQSITNRKQIIPQQGKQILALYSVSDGKRSTHNVIGNYTLKGNILQYTPMFALDNGMTFEAHLYTDADTIKKRFDTPLFAGNGKQLEVTEVYPLSNKVPKNILLFHVIFSDSMKMDEQAYKYIQLIDQNGKAQPKVWKEKSHWVTAKHLVLMIHPGRIKSEINYLAELGPVFKEGKVYTLVIAPTLEDRFNRPLAKEYRKKFSVLASDKELPKLLPALFKKPAINTTDPLILTFSEAMDYGSLLVGVTIRNKAGLPIKGTINPTSSDKIWHFVPQNTWQNIAYTVEFDMPVADLASNYLHQPFETRKIKTSYPEMPLKWKFLPEEGFQKK